MIYRVPHLRGESDYARLIRIDAGLDPLRWVIGRLWRPYRNRAARKRSRMRRRGGR